VLALRGDSAKEMHDFLMAVGHYLVKTKNGQRKTDAATAVVTTLGWFLMRSATSSIAP
jgi:hypothetical protein